MLSSRFRFKILGFELVGSLHFFQCAFELRQYYTFHNGGHWHKWPPYFSNHNMGCCIHQAACVEFYDPKIAKHALAMKFTFFLTSKGDQVGEHLWGFVIEQWSTRTWIKRAQNNSSRNSYRRLLPLLPLQYCLWVVMMIVFQLTISVQDLPTGNPRQYLFLVLSMSETFHLTWYVMNCAHSFPNAWTRHSMVWLLLKSYVLVCDTVITFPIPATTKLKVYWVTIE